MTTYTANPGDNLQTKASALVAGDTLILNDGTYSTSPGLSIAGIHGTAGAPITIKAANDGQAILDGGGTFAPIFMTNDSYVTLQGLRAQNSSSNVVYLLSSTGSGNGPLDHITLQRITAHGAANQNSHVFSITQNTSQAPPSALTNILVEDCAAWGPGRYMFVAYHADTVIFRRCFGYWNTITDTSQEPRAPFSVYGAKNVTLENCIGQHAIPYQAEAFNNYFAACWHTSDDTTNYPCDNTKVLGCIFYNNWDGWWVNDSAGTNLLFQDSYFESPSNAATWTTTPKGNAIEFNDPYLGAATVKNCTFRNSVIGLNKRNAANASTLTIQSNAFIGNATGMGNDPGHSYCDFFGNSANGTTLVASDQSVDPGWDTATYGKGGALFIPASSPLHGAGVGGTDIGANILYRYVNGGLTVAPLWPWPMEDRVVAELGNSPTFFSAALSYSGPWTTLAGVYTSPGTAYTTYRDSIEPQLVAALAAKNLFNFVEFIGPDTTMASDSWLTSSSADLASTLSGYVRHAFPENATDISGGSLEVAAKSLVSSIFANDPAAKPVIQGEMAFAAQGPGQSVALYQYGVDMADYAVQLARAGCAALIAYILDDDMHGTEWGMWQITTDTGTPRPWFFAWSLLSIALTPGSTLYAPLLPTSNDLRALAAQSPQGAWTLVLINRRATAQNVQVRVPNAAVVSSTLQVYAYSNAAPLLVDGSGLALPIGQLSAVLPRGFTVSLVANSVLILTQATATQTSVFDVKRPPLQKRR